MQKAEVLELIKDAMRAKDKARLSILRQVNEEFKKIEIDQRREVTEADVTACVKKLIKMTSETLEFSRKAGTDPERTEMLAGQVKVLEDLLPAQLGGAELEALIDQILAEGGYSSKKDMGKVMKELTARTEGNFDKPSAAKVLGGKLV